MAVSGKEGTVLVGASAVTEVTKWTFEPSAIVHKYASNNTSGHKKAVAGVRDGKGTMEARVDSDVVWKAGASVAVSLQGPTGSDTMNVPAVIASSPINVDMDNGEPITATYSFEADGSWTGAGIFAGLD